MQNSTFKNQGILHLKQFLPTKLVQQAQEDILKELERIKVRVKGQWQTRQFDAIPAFQIAASISQSVHPQKSCEALITDELLARMSELSGIKTQTVKRQPAALITPPQKEPWSIPHMGWHVDVAATPDNLIPGIQAFILLNDIAPKGGATMGLAGSHDAHHTTPKLLQALKEDSLFKDLFDEKASNRERFFRPQPFKQHQLQIIEMSGKAGDIYLMDMRTLHTPSINGAKQARMMLTLRCYRDQSI